ncbi:MAG: GntR family transcriptional regulator [Opitutales bacterium]
MEYKNVRDIVTDRLREEVLLGKFKTGESIREIPLAERYKVSRGPIRDALLQLSQEGLLENIPNRGVKVAKEWDESLVMVMVGIRVELESFAIKALVENPSDEYFRLVRDNLRMFKLACEDADMPTVVQLDLQFHRLMLRECGHTGLESVWLPMLGGLRLPYSRHQDLSESYDEHAAIVKAIEGGDAKAAIKALKQNIEIPFKD